MHKWQYSSVLYHPDGYLVQIFHDQAQSDMSTPAYPQEDSRGSLRRRVGELGYNGWELVSVLVHSDIGEEWILKRPIF